MKPALTLLIALLLAPLAVPAAAEVQPAEASSNQSDLDHLVAQTHETSLKLREDALRRTIAKDTCWPSGVWGDNLWCLAALFVNEKADEAAAPHTFVIPRVNETSINLRPSAAYRSPYLNGDFGSDRITVTVGPIKRILDFSKSGP